MSYRFLLFWVNLDVKTAGVDLTTPQHARLVFRRFIRVRSGQTKAELQTSQIPSACCTFDGQNASENWQLGKKKIKISVKRQREIMRENSKAKNIRNIRDGVHPLVNFMCEWQRQLPNCRLCLVPVTDVCFATSWRFDLTAAFWGCSHAKCHVCCDGHVLWMLLLDVWFMVQLLVTVRSIYRLDLSGRALRRILLWVWYTDYKIHREVFYLFEFLLVSCSLTKLALLQLKEKWRHLCVLVKKQNKIQLQGSYQDEFSARSTHTQRKIFWY